MIAHLPSHSRAWPAAAHLLLFAMIVALPLLLLVGLLLYRSVELERAELERRIVQVKEAVVADVDRDIDRDLTLLRTLATSPALSAEDWPALYTQAKGGLGQKSYLILSDAEGHQLVNTYVPYGAAPAMTGDPLSIQTIQSTKQPFVSDLFVSLVVRAPVYNVSIPILQDGELRYVMSLGLFPENLRQLLQAQMLEPDWTMTILDRKGVILARSRDHAARVGTSMPAAWLNYRDGTVLATLSLEGKRVLAATGQSGLSSWTVAVSYPAALVERQVRQSLLIWGLTIAAVAVLMLGLAVAFGRQITLPLAAARKAAEALGRGEAVDIENSRMSEANAVNRALQDAYQEITRSTAALKQNEELLQTAADAAQFGAHQYDVARDRSIRSLQVRQILGVGTDSDATFESGLELVHPDDRQMVRTRKQQILAAEDGYQIAYRIRRRDGEVRWVMDRGRVVRDADGKALRVVGVLLDITDLKAAEQRQRLLFDELNHRVKNTLAIVQSLAQQTLRAKPAPEEFAEAFGERLASLAGAHNLLTLGSWAGTELRKIVDSAMEPFGDDRMRIAVEGPTVIIPAGATITLCLMLHELATNAAKYGALSVPNGRVSIAWAAARSGSLTKVELRWREQGGPPVISPTRKGFGSRLLAASALQLHAELEVDYAVEGVRYWLRFTVPAAPPGDLSDERIDPVVTAS